MASAAALRSSSAGERLGGEVVVVVDDDVAVVLVDNEGVGAGSLQAEVRTTAARAAARPIARARLRFVIGLSSTSLD
jgi:hypothetical protein